MDVRIKFLKENIKAILIILLTIIILIATSIFINSKYDVSVVAVDLESGDVNTNALVINEVMTSNKGAYADFEGNLYDYVEIYNGTDKDIDLTNYGLSDNNKSVKWTFSNIVIKSKGYLVIFLSGEATDNYHANFRLKNGSNETLVLRKPNGKVIDAVDVKSVLKNQVLARDINGTWQVQKYATPNYPNTKEGREAFLENIKTKDNNTLVINEILPNNKGHFKNSLGEYSGYIEIKNISKDSINLKNYSLGKDLSSPFSYTLPDKILKSGEVLLIYTSNRNIDLNNELHANFKLDNKKGVVTLANNKGLIIDMLEYDNLPNGMSLVKESSGYYETNDISPGYNNDVNGIKSYKKKYHKPSEDLIISEVMNSNYEYLPQNGGEYYDFIELKNNSNKDIKLSDYYLTTDLDLPNMYKLPDVTLKKGAYYIIMASGDSNLSNSSYHHANFKLSEIEGLFLIKDNDIKDSLFIANVKKGYSIGRDSTGFNYLKPTPKKDNKEGSLAISYEPSFSLSSGIYNDVKEVKVSLKAEGTIYYTLDGSKPTTKSKVYKGPLSLKKTTVIKTASKMSGKELSEVATNSYIINENHTMNVMSVSLDDDDLDDLSSHAWVEGYIVPAYAEYFEKDGKTFEIGAGLKLFGGSTRGYAKKSFELKFKKEYGEPSLNYQVFQNRDFSNFNSLVLRTGSQDEDFAVIRDLVATSLVEEYTDVDVQAYVPIILYINGNYWGLYYIREKVDETFVGNHYNVKATKTNTDILRIDGQVKTGSSKKYKSILEYIRNNSLSKDKNYEYIKTKIDVNNMADYWVAEVWTANNDIVNCRYFSNPNVDSGKFKFIFYDLDYGMYNIKYNYLKFATNPSGMNGFSTELLRNMMKSKQFQKLFVERLSYNLKNTFNEKIVLEKIDEVEKLVEKEIERDFKKWKQNTMSNWHKEVDYLRKYAKERTKYLVEHTKSYFDLTNNDVKKYFGDVI